MQLNKVVLIGRVGERGMKVTYSEQAIPTRSLTLEVDEVSQSGRVFTTWLPVKIVGKYAEDAARSLEPGDEVSVDAKLKYRCLISNKTGENASKLVVSGWTVKAMSALVSASGHSHAEPSRRAAPAGKPSCGSGRICARVVSGGAPCTHRLRSLCRRGLPGHAGDGAGGGKWRHEAHATASMLPSP